MKKFVVMGALALAVPAFSREQAAAWTNARFGVGLNWERQSGANNFLWGMFRNGQVPTPAPGYPHDGHNFYPYPGPGAHPGTAEMQPAPAAPVPTGAHPSTSGVFEYPGYQMVSYPPYYPYYVPVNYGR